MGISLAELKKSAAWNTTTYVIGVDTGVNTGISFWNKEAKDLEFVGSVMIHKAMNMVISKHHEFKIFVRVEDARLRTWFGKTGSEVLMGAGSIQRDAKIWEDFLTDNNIPHEMVAPKNNKTKLSSLAFKTLTKYSKPTNEHARDAAMLCFGY